MEEIDGKAFDIVNIRLKRVASGNFGVARRVGDGVSELVIDSGPGYRVYFGQDGGYGCAFDRRNEENAEQGHCKSQSSLEGIQQCLRQREIISPG